LSTTPKADIQRIIKEIILFTFSYNWSISYRTLKIVCDWSISYRTVAESLGFYEYIRSRSRKNI